MTYTKSGTGGGTVTFARIRAGDDPDTFTGGRVAVVGTPSSAVCSASGTFKFKNNDSYRLTAAATLPATFAGWSNQGGDLTAANCGGTTNPCPTAAGSIALGSNSAITATFALATTTTITSD